MEIQLNRVAGRDYLGREHVTLRKGSVEISLAIEGDFLVDGGANCCAADSNTLAALTRVDPATLKDTLRRIKDGDLPARLSDFRWYQVEIGGGTVTLPGLVLPDVTVCLGGQVVTTLGIFTAYDWRRAILGTTFLDHVDYRRMPNPTTGNHRAIITFPVFPSPAQ